MSRKRQYRVSTQKLRKLRRMFKDDIRWLVTQAGKQFNPTVGVMHDGKKWVCDTGTCAVGAFVLRRQPIADNYSDDCYTAAQLLKVDMIWLYDVFNAVAEDDELITQLYNPQAFKLGQELRKYGFELQRKHDGG